MQQWTMAANGSLYVLDVRAHTGYCLTMKPTSTPKEGAQVYSADCAGLTTSNNGGTQANQTAGEFWEVKGSTLVSKDTNASSLCFGADPPTQGPNAKVGGGTGALTTCAAPSAQFTFDFSSTAVGTIVHKASGLCLTVGRCAAPPPVPPDHTPPQGKAPCDIYQSVGSPCVAAHSMVRALYSNYSGPLYAVRRSSDNTTTMVPVLAVGGFANSTVQDIFCQGTHCVVERIFDQTGNINHLGIYGADTGVNASADRHTVGGHAVYSAFFGEPGMGYRNINTSFIPGDGRGTGAGNKIPVGEQPESMYMVVSGRHFNNRKFSH
jgi:hypothetical protein